MYTVSKVKLFSLVALIAILAVPSFAADTLTGATINLSGIMPAVYNFSLTPGSGLSSLDVQATVADQPIATIFEQSNRRAGYTITMASTNSGKFINSTDGGSTDTLAYTLKIGTDVPSASGVTFVGGVATLTDISSKTTKAGATRQLYLSFDGSSLFLDQGTYSDTLTFTVTGK